MASSLVNVWSKLLTSKMSYESYGFIGASTRLSKIFSWSSSANQGCESTSSRPPREPRRFAGFFSSSYPIKLRGQSELAVKSTLGADKFISRSSLTPFSARTNFKRERSLLMATIACLGQLLAHLGCSGPVTVMFGCDTNRR